MSGICSAHIHHEPNCELCRSSACPSCTALAEQNNQQRDALIWMSGSDDFGPGGRAREGYEKLVLPLLDIPPIPYPSTELQRAKGRVIEAAKELRACGDYIDPRDIPGQEEHNDRWISATEGLNNALSDLAKVEGKVDD